MTLARSPVPRLDGHVPRKPSFSEYLPHKHKGVAGGREGKESAMRTGSEPTQVVVCFVLLNMKRPKGGLQL